MKTRYLACTLLVVVGCEDDGGNKCGDTKQVTGSIISVPIREPVVADLDVHGTIRTPENATVYAVQVNSVDATSTANDFRTWTAKVPIAVLAASAGSGGSVTLTAQALTNCGAEPVTVDTQTIQVDAAQGTLDSLAVAAVLPNSATYLPATKPASAIVMVTSGPRAAGAIVALTASLGTLSVSQVTLAGDGAANTSAQVLFSSTTAGTAVITASAQGKTATSSITVIGAPTFAPDGAVVARGNTLRVTVLTTGKIDTCQATPVAGLHVTSGAASDLMTATGGTDQTMDGLIDIDVAVDTSAAAGAATTISCRDVFGQVGTATFTVQP